MSEKKCNNNYECPSGDVRPYSVLAVADGCTAAQLCFTTCLRCSKSGALMQPHGRSETGALTPTKVSTGKLNEQRVELAGYATR